jgi:hypothetical protein
LGPASAGLIFYRHAGPITTDRQFGSNTNRDFIGNGARPSLLTERPEGNAPDRRFTLHHASWRSGALPQSHKSLATDRSLARHLLATIAKLLRPGGVRAVVDDPVVLGLVGSLVRPGGNATGVNFFSFEINAKRLGLMRELLPKTRRFAVLVNPAASTTDVTSKALNEAARTPHQELPSADPPPMSRLPPRHGGDQLSSRNSGPD